MEIKFIGNGSAFSNTNNNAFFEINNELIMIDCSMLNMNRIKELFNFNNYNKINVFITHMHGDHISGLPTFIQYLFHIYNIVINVIVPCPIKDDVKVLLDITGVKDNEYNLIGVESKNTNISYLVNVIKTKHTDNLLSFGYVFNINNKICVFTGDSNTLEPFNEYVDDCDEIYIDTLYYKVGAHINWDDLKNNLPKSKKIYLMHIDNDNIIDECKIYNNVEVVKLYEK